MPISSSALMGLVQNNPSPSIELFPIVTQSGKGLYVMGAISLSFFVPSTSLFLLTVPLQNEISKSVPLPVYVHTQHNIHPCYEYKPLCMGNISLWALCLILSDNFIDCSYSIWVYSHRLYLWFKRFIT